MVDENTNYVLYLIEQSQRGIRNAFFDLCEINLRSVYSICFRILDNVEVAKKITLDTFFHAWETIKDFNTESSYLHWIKDLAIKYSIFELKRNEYNTSYKKLKHPSHDPHELLSQLIGTLPDEDRIILVLHDVEDYDCKQIMEYLPELTLDEVKSKLINAREYLISRTT